MPTSRLMPNSATELKENWPFVSVLETVTSSLGPTRWISIVAVLGIGLAPGSGIAVIVNVTGWPQTDGLELDAMSIVTFALTFVSTTLVGLYWMVNFLPKMKTWSPSANWPLTVPPEVVMIVNESPTVVGGSSVTMPMP